MFPLTAVVKIWLFLSLPQISYAMTRPYVSLMSFGALLLVMQLLQSCGTMQYTAGPSPEAIEETRRLAIQQTLASDYGKIDRKYTPLTYGVLKVVKPDSYVVLDSLFERKYRNRYSGDSDLAEELDNAISRQQGIINNDTNPILYVETHWFRLENGDQTEFVTSEITLTKDNRIRNIRTLDSYTARKEDAGFAEAFAKEESIFAQGMLYSEEANFYKMYKSRAMELQGAAKDTFLMKTFGIMRIAQANRSYSTERLMQSLARQQYLKDFPDRASHSLDIKANEVLDTTGEKQQFLYYEVLVTDLTEPQSSAAGYRFDQYLMPAQ
jgi:hypothetical protein